MRLLIMRHGPAEDNAPSGRDFDRELSANGRVRTASVARELVRRGETPERILSSPLLRAVQTAELVATALGGGVTVEIRNELEPAEDATGLVREVAKSGAKNVLFVGHAPDVAELVQLLSDARVSAFAPATVVALDFVNGRADRRFTIDSATLAG